MSDTSMNSALARAVDWGQAPAWASAYEVRNALFGRGPEARWLEKAPALVPLDEFNRTEPAPVFVKPVHGESYTAVRVTEGIHKAEDAHPILQNYYGDGKRPYSAVDAPRDLARDLARGLGDISEPLAYRGVSVKASQEFPSTAIAADAQQEYWKNHVDEKRPGENPNSHNVSGYRKMADHEVEAINALKQLELKVAAELNAIDALSGHDKRCAALAKTHMEIAFMFAVKAIARPLDPYRR